METSVFPKSSLQFEKPNSQQRRQHNYCQSSCELGQMSDMLEMTLPNTD